MIDPQLSAPIRAQRGTNAFQVQLVRRKMESRMRQPRLAMLADRLTALLPKNGLSVSRDDAKVDLQCLDSTITEHDFEGAVALAAARRQITRTFGGAAISRFK